VNQQNLLLLPPLIGGIRDEGEFEEDEPGKIVVRVYMYDESMYVCMYVCILLTIYKCTRLYMYTYTFICINTYI
jgi:hypothetical protein